MFATDTRSAMGVHHTAVSQGGWDGPGNEARLPSGKTASFYARVYAWRDPDGDEGAKSTYRFIHHEVSADGTPGAANMRACSTGIGVLNGGRGGTTIPEADRAGVHRHLAAHMTDGDMEPPVLRALVPESEIRSLPIDQAALELRQEGDGPKTITWYAALFDTLSEDLGGFRERIGRRAFTDSLQTREVRSLVNHDPNMILGRTSKGTLKLDVDLKGLHAETQIPETSYARDLLVNIGNGNIGGGSFKFRVPPDGDTWKIENLDGQDTLVRTVREMALFDVSLVTFPAYPATEGTLSLRSLAESWRERLAQPGRPPALGHLKRRLRLNETRFYGGI